MSIGDFLILGILAVAAFFALRYVLRGKSSCSGGCSGCPHSGCCRRDPTAKIQSPESASGGFNAPLDGASTLTAHLPVTNPNTPPNR